MECCLVVNGNIPMSPGKLIGQAFQAAARFQRRADQHAQNMGSGIQIWLALEEWHDIGTRTIVKIAETPTIWKRITEEIPGFTMNDEGHTEVAPGSATIYVCAPYRFVNRPKLLDNKKVPKLDGAQIGKPRRDCVSSVPQ